MTLRSASARLAGWAVVATAAFLPLSIVGAQWGGLFMALAALGAFAAGARGLLPRGLAWPVAAFALVCVLASLCSPADLPWRGWVAWRPALFLLAVPAAVVASGDPERTARRAVLALLVAAVAMAVLGMVQRYTAFDLNHALGLRKVPLRVEAPSGTGWAAVGAFNSRLTYAEVLAAAFVVAAAAALVGRTVLTRLAALGASAAIAMGVAAAFTRAAWIGALAGLLTLAVGLRRKALLALAGIILALGAAGAAVPAVRERALSAVKTTANPDRLFMWTRAGEVLADHPVTGVGVYGYPLVAGAYYDKFDPHFPMRTWAHDMYLTLLVETGPAGLIAYVWMFVVAAALAWGAVRRALPGPGPGPKPPDPWHAIRLGAMGGAVSLLGASFFHDVLYDGEAAMTLFFLAGLAVAAIAPAEEPAAAAPAVERPPGATVH